LGGFLMFFGVAMAALVAFATLSQPAEVAAALREMLRL
jgi:hypothetical protein